MTKEEFANLKIDGFVYNKKTNQILIAISELYDKSLINEQSGISLEKLDSCEYEYLALSEIENYGILDDNAPDKVLIDFLRYKMEKLEQFVFSRLR